MSLQHIVSEILSQGSAITALANQKRTPCYVYDEINVRRAINRFRKAFDEHLPGNKPFYAVKVNHYEPLLRYVFQEGFGADVSSARELDLAIHAGAREIVFSGPGKTRDELECALRHATRTIINIDSFGELRRIAEIIGSDSHHVRAGVRVSFPLHGRWNKFGIPVEQLGAFLTEAAAVQQLQICAIQFHISWNESSAPYESAIEQLASTLRSIPLEARSLIRIVDLGGGFRPHNSEGYYPNDDEHYEVVPAATIEQYAQGIGRAVDRCLRPLGDFEYYLEPGRIICNDSMHVVLQVEDVKDQQCIITNGGTNIVGFERFEVDYFPVINLTHPSMTERPCMVYGSLCMPQDYWGKHMYSDDVAVGDIIVVPYQGALTYANMQAFIKGEAPVFHLQRNA